MDDDIQEPRQTLSPELYKWRVIGFLGLVIPLIGAVTITSVGSGSMTAGHNVALYGMLITFITAVTLLVLGPGSTYEQAFDLKKQGGQMLLSIVAGIVITVVGTIIAAVVIAMLGLHV